MANLKDATPVPFNKDNSQQLLIEDPKLVQFNFYNEEQLENIQRAIATLCNLAPQVSDKEPANPQRGWVRYAIDPWHPLSSTSGDDGWVYYDGTNWVDLITGLFTSAAPGLVPASGGGTVNFLRADASFAVPQHATLLSSTNFTGSSANIDFTSISNAYDDLQFEFIGLSGDNATTNLRIQVSVNNGGSYTASAITGITRGSGTVTNSAVTTGAILNGTTFGIAAVLYGSLHLRRYSAAASGYFNGFLTKSDAGFFDDFAGWINKSAAIDAVRFSVSAGSFDAGTINMYGLKRA